MILQPDSNQHDPGSPWDEVDHIEAEAQHPPPRQESSEEADSRGSIIIKGERRGSTGASRPAVVTESRDSLQSITEQSTEKPLSEALKFDLTQPWQRSLLRDLERIENSMVRDESEARPRPHADRILLGHAESGDYLLECEDDISTATDTSSTCPTRLQVVHRYQFPMRPRVAGREEDSPTPDPAKFFDIRNGSPKGVYDEASFSLSDHEPPAPPIPYLAHPKQGPTSSEGFRPIPHALPYGTTLSQSSVPTELFRANAFSEEVDPAESSRVLVEEEQDYFSDPACMCMGYSSLIDLILFKEPTVRKKKRRTNVWESPPTSRRSSLGRVQEEDEEDTFTGLNAFCMPQPQPYAQSADNIGLFEKHRY